MVAMRAAQFGIELKALEVTIASHSDNRGMLGDDAVPAGPLGMQLTVRIAADGVPAQQLQELVHWAERHSPVGDALRRAMPITTDVRVE